MSLKTGVIGLGRIGKIHLNNLLNRIRDVEVKTISDISGEVLKEIQSDFNLSESIKITQDYMDIMEDREIDAVIVTSPTPTHTEIILEAISKKKHIFCEKPIALKIENINKIINSLKGRDLTFGVGFNRRHDPSFNKAREMIKSGEIGKPYMVKITSRDPEPPPLDYIKNSGGIFLDMSIHDLDMARFLVDDKVSQIMAVGECLVNPEIRKFNDIDTAIINIKYESGLMGVIENCRKSPPGYDNRIEVLGSKGVVSVSNKKPTEVSLSNEKGIIGEKPLYFFDERYQEAYVKEMQDFIKAVKGKREPLGTIQDGLIAAKMAEAAEESLQQEKFVNI